MIAFLIFAAYMITAAIVTLAVVLLGGITDPSTAMLIGLCVGGMAGIVGMMHAFDYDERH